MRGGVYTYMKWSRMLLSSSISRIQAEGQGKQIKCNPRREETKAKDKNQTRRRS